MGKLLLRLLNKKYMIHDNELTKQLEDFKRVDELQQFLQGIIDLFFELILADLDDLLKPASHFASLPVDDETFIVRIRVLSLCVH